MQQGDAEMGVKDEEGEDEDEEDDYFVDDAAGRYLQASPVAMAPPPALAAGGGGRRRAREEKERTKLRERQRRAVTGRILAGLRQHGNYSLRARADINEVIAALAKEAGWVVLPDGTTFPSSSSLQVCGSFSFPPFASSARTTSWSWQLSTRQGKKLGEQSVIQCIYGVIN